MFKVFDFSRSINPAFLVITPSLPLRVQRVVHHTLPLLNASAPTRTLLSYALLAAHSKDLAQELIDLIFAKKDWDDLKPAMQKTAGAVCRLALSLWFPYLYLVGSEIYDLILRFWQFDRTKGMTTMATSTGGIMMQFLYLFSLLGDSPTWKYVLEQIPLGKHKTGFKDKEFEELVLKEAPALMASQKVLENFRILPLIFRNFPEIPDTATDRKTTLFQGCVHLVAFVGRIYQANDYSHEIRNQPLKLSYVIDCATRDFFGQMQDLRETAIPLIQSFLAVLTIALEIPQILHLLEGFNYHVGATGKPVKMDDVVGCEEAKKSIAKALDQVKNSGKYTALGLADTIKGILLFGPPGTGKSMLAKAFATAADNAKFIEQSGSSFVQIYVGQGAKNVRTLFAKATRLAAQDQSRLVVLFIDEINAIGQQRGFAQDGEQSESNSTTEAFLVEMDRLPHNVIVIGATNKLPQDLDPAFVRSGRFDQHIEFKLPTEKERQEILTKLSSKYKVDSDVDESLWKEMARQTDSWCYADFDNLMKQAAQDAGFKNHPAIKKSTIKNALDKLKKQKSQGTSSSLMMYV